ncbi:MAG: hypothetical protein LBR11_10240 [Deltaproteobacteria bacterium]|nr:hypothetical protein [Deltaproteobacteria bacterium]
MGGLDLGPFPPAQAPNLILSISVGARRKSPHILSPTNLAILRLSAAESANDIAYCANGAIDTVTAHDEGRPHPDVRKLRARQELTVISGAVIQRKGRLQTMRQFSGDFQ